MSYDWWMKMLCLFFLLVSNSLIASPAAIEVLSASGLTHSIAQARTMYADIGDLTNDSTDFCRQLLDETGVAITSGLDFDPDRGNRTVRLSYCAAPEDIAEAMDRMGSWLNR